ncbi:Ribonuclease Y [Phycisphaerae bacterium RAS1]|nr:Ribonuclease Y [Phycisphaerae bacterium RAS1]
MAGRPVAARGGFNGLFWGMISFVIVSVLSLAGLIMTLTKVKDAEDAARVANTALAKAGTAPAYFSSEAAARNSRVFDVVADHQKRISQLVAGVPDLYAPQLQKQAADAVAATSAAAAGVVAPTDPLLTVLQRMDEKMAELTATAAAARAELQSVQADKQALTSQLKAVRDQFEAQTAELNKRLQQNEEEKVGAIAAKDEQLTELTASMDSTSQQLQQARRDTQTRERDCEFQVARLTKQVEDQLKQIRNLNPSPFEPGAILRKPDGKVLRAIPGSDIVYINLGAADKIKRGFGFEVFSATREVARSLRGKASIEVISVNDSTAECRVTRGTSGQPIIEGDSVVNIAFERNRKPKFVIRGDFDLDYDGDVDLNGVEAIATIVRQWGGQVAAELDESTDYVVIGLSPQVGAALDADGLSEVERDLNLRRELERTQFAELVKRASSMFIPVITQNQFLYLTGYSGDTTLVSR